MAKQILEGSHAVAQVVNNCQPAVVSAYPITPQTHIVEDLEKLKADGEADYEYVRAESEFAAASIVLGASATGVRTYTATSSQGLLLMAEVLFNIAGIRLPVVLTCANRAVSGPISIWNDQQDAVTVRDSGWLQLYGETNQEVVDLHVLAFRLAESLQLPVMVNMDGFVLTHTYEPIELPSQAAIKKYLPAYRPDKDSILDINNPRSLGTFAPPNQYMEIRQELYEDVMNSKSEIIKLAAEYKKIFGRGLGNNGLIEEYQTKNADIILVAMGSVCGTIKEVIDQQRKNGLKVGLLKIISFRPFADQEVVTALAKATQIAVIDKSISIGTEGILASEIKRAVYNKLSAKGGSASGGKTKIQSFIVGLGGRDVSQKMIEQIIKDVTGKENKIKFITK
jgi:pyruvate ferredoxin oxidoreductase alpha subunit